MEEISETIRQSYRDKYNSNMGKTASVYSIPNVSVQDLVLKGMADKIVLGNSEVSTIEELLNWLVTIKAFRQIEDVITLVKQTIRECVSIAVDTLFDLM